MYKLFLCWRYLRTRWIALASIVSVMLGVATMIVVNSVMQGFAVEMQNRIHGILSDVIVEARDYKGMRDPEWHIAKIREAAGDDIEAMTPTVVVPALITYQCNGKPYSYPVQLIGIDAKTQSSVTEFGRSLLHPANQQSMTFDLREDGYDVREPRAHPEAYGRVQMREAGWVRRRGMAQEKAYREQLNRAKAPPAANATSSAPSSPVSSETATQSPAEESTSALSMDRPDVPAGTAATSTAAPSVDPFAHRASSDEEAAGSVFDMAKQQHTGIVLGIAIASRRTKDGEEVFMTLPGDDVTLSTANVDQPPKFVNDWFTIVDFYESKMSEYDSSFVFVPIDKLQEWRGMYEPSTGARWVNSIQIKLKPGADGDAVRDKIQAAAAFDTADYVVSTWRDKQGPLLAAVRMETAILNVLLFMIIAVAGFGILAIFYMIVVEKTRDIGILKSLGASKNGVMAVFLGYGLSLGLVGSGVGLAAGLLIVHYINQIADGLGRITGYRVFDPKIYYFYKIPAIVVPATVMWIVGGALCIAVLASVLPARRAAKLHPVEALRYE